MSCIESVYIPAGGDRLSEELLQNICGGSKELIDKQLKILELLENDVKREEMKAENLKIHLPLFYGMYYGPNWRDKSQVHIWRDSHARELDMLRKSA